MLYTFYKNYGSIIYIRYKKGTRTVSTKFSDYKPSLYTTNTNGDPDTERTDIYENKLKKLSFETIRDAKSFVKQYKDVDGLNIVGNSDYGNQFIIDLLDGKSPEYNPYDIIGGIVDIEVHAPEMPKAENPIYPITAITTYNTHTKRFDIRYLKNESGQSWSYENSKMKDTLDEFGFDVHEYDSERTMLIDYISFFKNSNFDFTSGWNSEFFDVPYTVCRIEELLGEQYAKKLSPFGMINKSEKRAKFGKPQLKVEIFGIPELDYLSLYKKHILSPRSSYKLDDIAEIEVGHKKLDYSEYQNLRTLYTDNLQLYVDYNIQDVNLIRLIDEQCNLFGLTFTIAYYTLSNYADTLGTVNLWEKLIAKHLYNTNRVPLFSRESYSGDTDFEGAYVHPPIVGRHKWIFAIDLNSLYPHIEMENNIGPETHVPSHELPDDLLRLKGTKIDDLLAKSIDLSVLKKYDYTMTPNIQFYRKDKMSFLSEIKRELYSMRKVHKKKAQSAEQELNILKNEYKTNKSDELKSKINALKITNVVEDLTQLALKLLLNGGYGAVGNTSFLYYKRENAEAITTMGQFVNRFTCAKINEFLNKTLRTKGYNYHIYSDTDSGYFTLYPLIKKLGLTDKDKCVKVIDEFHKTILDPFIAQVSDEIADYLNVYEQKMVWGREIIASDAIWIAKKKYVAKVWNNEGIEYIDPKYKIMGMESVKSSTPLWARELLKELYIIALNGTEADVIKFYKKCRKHFDGLSIEEIAIPSGVNGLEDYYDPVTTYKKGAQAHVKAALYHNKLVNEKNLKHIAELRSGNKIKYLYLKKQNPYKIETIGFDGWLPPEFNLEKYVDRDTLFEKGFENNCKIFLESLGWSYEQRVTLEL